MGNQASTVLPESENRLVEEEELLIREITKTSIDLADMYQQKFLEPDFCNKVSLIASNSLWSLLKLYFKQHNISIRYRRRQSRTKK